MKALDLVEKIARGASSYSTLDRQSAKTAFMANLIAQLGIQLPESIFDGGLRLTDDDDERTRIKEAIQVEAKFSFYSGVLVGHAKDVPEKSIVAAHCAMSFPWARAIVA